MTGSLRTESSRVEKAVCKFCGSDKGFEQHGRVETSGSRTLRSFERQADGKVKATWGSVETDYCFEDFEPDGVVCRSCGREEATLKDFLGKPVAFEPGTVVVCPDGLRGVVAEVDPEARKLKVENWHEEFAFAEVTALEAAA